MPLSRRRLLQTGLLAALPWPAAGAPEPVRGGQLVVGTYPEPTSLTASLTTDGAAQLVRGKIFDGLLSYDAALNPKPELALSWSVGADGLSIAFALRPGVTWHDGTPFTSADVAYSLTEIWQKFHSRGRSTFANVVAAETPDPLTVVWKLSRPAPYLLSALASTESQIVPKHLYAGTDVLTNPYNAAPIGTGPFRFVKWERGSYVALERNPEYWDQPKPYLDRLVLRFIADPALQSIALENGEIQLSGVVAANDISRLAGNKNLRIDPASATAFGYSGLLFNLDRPCFADIRVRRAFAHAIDTEFIREKIYYGRGQVETGPIPPSLAAFYTPDVQHYEFDLDKATALLDEAGLRQDADGTRLSIVFVPQVTTDAAARTAEYIRFTLGRIGIRLAVQQQDFAAFIRRIYMLRDFDLSTYGGQAGPDPAIGTQRIYWSKNFQPGVAFSNGAHYVSAETDRLLEAAQTELDPALRRDLYFRFQRQVQTDLPLIPLVSPEAPIVVDRRLQQYRINADSLLGNFAEASFVSTS